MTLSRWFQGHGHESGQVQQQQANSTFASGGAAMRGSTRECSWALSVVGAFLPAFGTISTV